MNKWIGNAFLMLAGLAFCAIDLASQLPKDTALYLDPVHFGKAGSHEVAEIIGKTLCPWPAQRYSVKRASTCEAAQ